MRVYRPTYKENGKNRKYANYYIELKDHQSIIRRIPAFSDKAQSEQLGKKINDLVIRKYNHEQPDVELSKWLETIPAKLRNRLAEIGLLDSQRAAAGKKLMEHLDDFYNALLADGTTEKQSQLVKSRAEKIIKGCGFVYWTDISASRVQQEISDLRKEIAIVETKTENGKTVKQRKIKDLGAASVQTKNFYLQAIKQFCKWMVQDRRAAQSPVDYLQGANIKNSDRRHTRRPFTVDEARRLLEAAKSGSDYQGLSGYGRALAYQLAIETGFRADEIRSLTVNCFDFDRCTVSLGGDFTKNHKSCTLPLRPQTAIDLKKYFTDKLPGAQAFKLPAKTHLMIQHDLEKAEIKYCEDGQFRDFHALRHTCGTWLAAAGVHPKIAMEIMRHSDISLTMNIYTHSLTGQQNEAVLSLPDLTLSSEKIQQENKTKAV